MRPPRFAYCRLCGGRWVAIEGVVQRHRPGCLLARPGARHSDQAVGG